MKNDGKDVKILDDAILYLQNCIACENHAYESYTSTKDEKFLDIAKRIRRNRSKLMYKIIPQSKAEIYCICKHLLAMAMALKEISSRYSEGDEKELAKECLEEASTYEQLFKLLAGGKNAI